MDTGYPLKIVARGEVASRRLLRVRSRSALRSINTSSSGDVQVIALPKRATSQGAPLAAAAALSVVIHAVAFVFLDPTFRTLPEQVPSKQGVLQVRLVPKIIASRGVAEEASATPLPDVPGASVDTTTTSVDKPTKRTPIRAAQRPRSVLVASASPPIFARGAGLPAPTQTRADETATPPLAAEPPAKVLDTALAVKQTAARVVGEIGQGSDAGQAGEAGKNGDQEQRSSATTAASVAYRNNPKPDYPLAARRDEQHGLVVLRVLVSKDGRPAEIRIGKSSRFSLLDAAAVAGVKRWSFIAAQSNRKSVDAWMDIPIRFRLDDNAN